jgi:hypothetical protein
MGREAIVQCQWAHQAGLCKVLLESNELIVRGELRRRVPMASLRDVSVNNDELQFTVDGCAVSISLGSALAERWAKALSTPPPSLAKKLGISPASRVLVLGEIQSKELDAAIVEAETTGAQDANLVIIPANNTHDLNLALNRLAKRPLNHVPLWIVYPKGSAGALGETSVREILRELGYVDTKVASVSSAFTALRFVRRGQ